MFNLTRDDDWKFVVARGRRYLFNLKTDKTEQNNLIEYYPEQVKRLEKAYKEWFEEVWSEPRFER